MEPRDGRSISPGHSPWSSSRSTSADPLIIVLAKLSAYLQERRAVVYISVKILSPLLSSNVEAGKSVNPQLDPFVSARQYWLTIQNFKPDASSFTGNLRRYSSFIISQTVGLPCFAISLMTSWPHRCRNEAHWIQPHDTPDTYYKLTRQSKITEPKVCAKGSNLRSDVLPALSIFNCGHTVQLSAR